MGSRIVKKKSNKDSNRTAVAAATTTTSPITITSKSINTIYNVLL